MATARPTRDERRAETRERVLRAAEQVFGERGYHAASVDEVAEVAGFSTGALYSNFEGKEDLFLEVLERQIDRQSVEIADSIADVPTIEDRTRMGAAQWVAYVEREPRTIMLFMEFWAYAVRNPDVRARFALRYARVREAMTAMIERSARELDVELKLPAEELAVVLDALADGFALQQLADPDAVPGDLFGKALMMLFEGARA